MNLKQEQHLTRQNVQETHEYIPATDTDADKTDNVDSSCTHLLTLLCSLTIHSFWPVHQHPAQYT